MKGKTILITGASSGIGKACADYLQQAGHSVYRASRSLQTGDGAASTNVRMDVDDNASVAQAVGQIIDKEGRIDVVVNCAGFGIAGSVEDTSVEEAKAQFETNFFGVLRVCHAVLPIMRQQGSGLIINISSIAGLISVPFQGFYSASKFALEGMTEALRLEVSPFGIRVVLVEPGDFQTGFSASRRKVASSENSSAYRNSLAKALSVSEKDESKGHQPIAIARLIERIIRNPSPKLRYSIGPVFERLSPTLKNILPYRLTEWLTMKYFDLR
jgi:NAD(P)-dependent dehydrogenase (short-subunit alcohol dehydrogenase family)